VRRLRIIVGCSLLSLLAGCGASSSTSTVTCDQQFWNNEVAACLPKGWKVLSQEQLALLGVPEETVAAFQFETAHAGQTDSVTVTKETLVQETKTPDYSASSIQGVASLPEYKLLDKITVTVDGSETAIHVFSARTQADQPVRRYYQLSVAKDRVGYTFTGSFPLSIQESEAADVEFILKNVSLKDPSVKAGK
jgi:hypothetical protein